MAICFFFFLNSKNVFAQYIPPFDLIDLISLYKTNQVAPFKYRLQNYGYELRLSSPPYDLYGYNHINNVEAGSSLDVGGSSGVNGQLSFNIKAGTGRKGNLIAYTFTFELFVSASQYPDLNSCMVAYRDLLFSSFHLQPSGKCLSSFCDMVDDTPLKFTEVQKGKKTTSVYQGHTSYIRISGLDFDKKYWTNRGYRLVIDGYINEIVGIR